jgi:hypothetical protein
VFYTHNFISEFPFTGCSEIKMRNILKNRTALSTVVTTLIILVVSVLLAGVVTYFAINVTSTRVQEESLNIVYQHVWYSTTPEFGGAEAAIMITCTGGRDVVLNKIAVRGQPVSWNNVWVYIPATGETANDFLRYCNQTIAPATNTTLTQDDSMTGTFAAVPAGVPQVMKSASTMVLYLTSDATSSPGSVTVNDVGLSIAISVFTSQATYYKETNVNAAGQ